MSDSALAKIATALDSYPDEQHPNRRGRPTLAALMAREIIEARARIAELEALPRALPVGPRSFVDAMNAAERAYWQELMPRHGGDVHSALLEAQVDRSTVYKRIGRMGLGDLIRPSKLNKRKPAVREGRSPNPPNLRLRRVSDPKFPKLSERRP